LDRRFLHYLVAAALLVPAVLLSDGAGAVSQIVPGIATAAFLWLFATRSHLDSRPILCAIVVATLGEVVLSLGWGLYTYRFATLPLYVPFGHGLFYALAAESARQDTLRRHARAITRTVLIAGSILAVASFALLSDHLGLLWWVAAALLITRARENALLLSVCFVYTILLEWLGTAIGNWRWAADVPLVPLHSANPPSGVGILYILLDLITVSICLRFAATDKQPEITLVLGDCEPIAG